MLPCSVNTCKRHKGTKQWNYVALSAKQTKQWLICKRKKEERKKEGKKKERERMEENHLLHYCLVNGGEDNCGFDFCVGLNLLLLIPSNDQCVPWPLCSISLLLWEMLKQTLTFSQEHIWLKPRDFICDFFFLSWSCGTQVLFPVLLSAWGMHFLFDWTIPQASIFFYSSSWNSLRLV